MEERYACSSKSLDRNYSDGYTYSSGYTPLNNGRYSNLGKAQLRTSQYRYQQYHQAPQYDRGTFVRDTHPKVMTMNSAPEFSTPDPLPSFTFAPVEISPVSSVPCPRISKATPSCATESYPSYTPPPPNNYGYHTVPESHPSPVPSLSYDTYSSSSPQSLSINSTPLSSYSELPDDRPRRRRRVTQPKEVVSESARKVGDTTSSSKRKNRKTRKRESSHVSTEGSSFSTFMVKPATGNIEPSGAMYMSTVDFNEDDVASGTFEHGPTDLPPRPYMGGQDAQSPWKPRKNLGTIPGSALDYLPIVEDRMARLEKAIEAYVQYRGELAARNSIIPGLDADEDSQSGACDSSEKMSLDS